jgi:segregation and condensation protein A
MPRRSRSRGTTREEDGDFAGVEVIDTDVSLQSSDDFVGLIEQPAWKTILISLVKSEKMDPWNIDVKELAKKYLEKIRSLNDSDLRLPANAILASAILLKFKARALRIPSLEEANEVEWKALMTEEQLLGGMMPELLSPNLSREGKVTLDQLVESIEAILDRTKSKVQRERDGRDRPVFNLPFASMNLEDKMKEVFEMVSSFADETGLARFSTMMKGRSINEVIEFFLALLFLVNDRTLNAWQETLFGDIFISRVENSSSLGESASVA